jgi:predicted nucleic acid-binding protein
VERVEGMLQDFVSLPIIRYPHELLVPRMWQLQDNLSGYDATFVALSEALGVPLITTDARLARADGHAAQIELF